MEITSCKEEDLDDCAKLLAEVYAEAPYCEKWTIANAGSYLSRFYHIGPEGCFIARSSTLLGAIFSYSYPWHNAELIYIQELFVSPASRRQGVARCLVKAAGKGKSIRSWLVANERSAAAGFYKAMGFSEEGPYRFYSGVTGI